jgi:hypothetical protein
MSATLPAYEKLGVFYLGRPCDPASGETAPAPFLYDARDLTTHGLCVGMTGSGKTGLCVSLLEEAAMDGVPALVIDPKGDLGNLLLTFPDLAPADFEPWVDPEAARRDGVSVAEYAAGQAELWKNGLGKWDEDGERIRRLRAAADFRIYTPGSSAGLPVSVLSSFAAPPPALAADADLLRDRVATTVSSLLGLLGLDADPVKSRDHILLSLLLDDAWRRGEDLDLAALIQRVQKPPVEKVGVMPLETFYAADDRFELAMALNNLLASPGFGAWLEGEPLDVGRLLYTDDGRPRVAIFSIGHLSEAERMFFVSLLLNQTLGWMRGLSGSSSLRALVYMDEVFGYLPPVAEPPSKKPLLTLLKQGRAFGLGVLLATQNPVDLDYKGLSNIGTWFLGRLQTQRDKDRLLDGLLGAAGDAGLDRGELDALLSALDKRVFLAHNVHEAEPVVFRTRWAMSYLAGPLTRDQIRHLSDPLRASATPAAAAPTPGAPPAAEPATAATPPASAAAARPVLPPEVAQTFLAPAGGGAATVTYHPHLLGLARVHFVDTKLDLEHAEDLALLAPLASPADPSWPAARELDLDPERDLYAEPPVPAAAWADPPPAAGDPRSLKSWTGDLEDALYRGRRLELPAAERFDLVSRPGEPERDFRIRLAETARQRRDAELDELRQRWARKIEQQEERVRRAAEKVEREEAQASDVKRQGWFQMGSAALSVAGALFNSRRKVLSQSNLSRARSAVSAISRGGKESGDVERAGEALEREKAKLAEVREEAEKEASALGESYDVSGLELDVHTVRPRRTDVDVRRLLLAWVPDET